MEKKVIEAIHKDPYSIELDQVGYFIIKLIREEGIIEASFYHYNKELQCVIQGKDARSIYWTIIENGWVTDISHAAYLGKELAFAEVAVKENMPYEQH